MSRTGNRARPPAGTIQTDRSKGSARMNPDRQNLLHHPAFPGVLLFLVAVAALAMANSPWAGWYDRLLLTPAAVAIGDLGIHKPLLLWINDGLMAVFFFLVGLEIKREVVSGELSSVRKMALPVVAALGGMTAPALIYAALNRGTPEIAGWAIPAATDIAFALGVLALLGSRVPKPLKLFLLSLAIVDDLGAIVVIALFYTADLSLASLGVAAAGLAALFVLNRTNVVSRTPYVLIGLVIWVGVLKSGVHATLAGVLVALFIPMSGGGGRRSPLEDLEHDLQPWVAFLILPLFAFMNAGVSLEGVDIGFVFDPLPLGVALGLFLGNQAGILGFVFLAEKANLCRRPEGVTWPQIYGVALIAGVGFTMSLFIGTLAFDDPMHAVGVRIGVLLGSMVSGIVGFTWCCASCWDGARPRRSLPRPEDGRRRFGRRAAFFRASASVFSGGDTACRQSVTSQFVDAKNV